LLPGKHNSAFVPHHRHLRSRLFLYHQNAYNCWVAAGGYVVIALLAGLRFLKRFR
uniref:ABC transporter permease n=1 Tax=Angiostrongylus cantonensis TaxID=6313 RepID=A0A0K0D133_ANGCA